MPNMSGTAGGAGAAAITYPLHPSFLITTNAAATLYTLKRLDTGVTMQTGVDWGALVNTAIAACPTNASAPGPSGGQIRTGPGLFQSATIVHIDRYGVRLTGDGLAFSTVIQQNADLGAGRALIEIGAVGDTTLIQNCYIGHLNLFGKQNDGTFTHGRGINVYASDCELTHLRLQAFNEHPLYWGPGGAASCYQGRLNFINVYQWGRTGVYTQNGIHIDTGCSDFEITECYTNCGGGAPVGNNGGSGFYIAGGAIKLINCHAWFCNGTGSAIGTDHLAGFKIVNGDVDMMGCSSESNNHHGVYAANAADLMFADCRFYANGRSYTDNAADTASADVYLATCVRVQMSNCKFRKQVATAPNAYRHLWLDTCSDGQFGGLEFWDVQDAHMVLATCSRMVFTGVTFGNGLTYSGGGAINGRNGSAACYIVGGADNVFSGGMVNGSIQESSASDRNTYRDLKFVSGTFTITGTSSKIYNCQGQVTVNSGVSSKANGNTIAHGLIATPTRYRVSPTVAQRAANVTGVDGTNLTISLFDLATPTAIAAAENVYWEASVYQ